MAVAGVEAAVFTVFKNNVSCLEHACAPVKRTGAFEHARFLTPKERKSASCKEITRDATCGGRKRRQWPRMAFSIRARERENSARAQYRSGRENHKGDEVEREEERGERERKECEA